MCANRKIVLYYSEDGIVFLNGGIPMMLKNVKIVSSLKTAVFLTAVSAIGLSLSVLCSRNNPLDPQAGNYDIGVNLLADPGFENQDTAHWRGAVSGGRL